MIEGGFYSQEDEIMQNRVAVLGYEVYSRLYEGENAVGTTIRIGDQPFEVVGVVDYKGGSGMMNPDDQVYIPFNRPGVHPVQHGGVSSARYPRPD